MGLFRRRYRRQPLQAVYFPPSSGYPGDAITIPFRFVEALRVSMHTIAEQPEVPADVRMWVTSWLRLYNAQLVTFMRKAYGDNIIPILDQITRDVLPDPDISSTGEGNLGVPEQAWAEWERQFAEENGNKNEKGGDNDQEGSENEKG